MTSPNPMTLNSLSEDITTALGTQCPVCGKETFIPSFSNGQVLYVCTACEYTETYVSDIAPVEDVGEDFRAVFEQFVLDAYHNTKEYLGDNTDRFFNSPVVKKMFSSIRAKVKSFIHEGGSLEDIKSRLYDNSLPHVSDVLIPAFEASLADEKEFTSQWFQLYKS